LHEKLGNAGVVCRRCGISRPALRKWWNRFKANGTNGSDYESRRPASSPTKKIFLAEEQLIYELRKRKLGHRRIQIELNRLNNIALSTATIYKVLL
jgi:transposase-like protein